MRVKLDYALAFGFCAFAILGCQSGDPGALPTEVGTLQMPLQSVTTDGSEYRLIDATFEVRGASQSLFFSGELAGTSAAFLRADLEVGEYTLQILDGWRMVHIDEGGIETPQRARLLSSNTLTFAIAHGRTTSLRFRFLVTEGRELDLEAETDGFGAMGEQALGCDAPESDIHVGDDCDDWCAACHPPDAEGNMEAEDVCDGLDTDCDA